MTAGDSELRPGDAGITAGWQEDDSAHFIDMGEVLTADRRQMGQVMLDMIPAERDEPFVAVEIGCGAGWLTEALLERYPQAQVIALDGSPTMLRHAEERLAAYADRVEFRHFRLEERDWIDRIETGVRCFLSSLVIHHLDGEAKRQLFARLLDRLEPGGALCVADLVEPASEWARRQMANAWTAAVERQSQELTGGRRAHDFFIEQQWNIYDFPDPDVDKPSPLFDQLRWLAEAGYEGIDVPWVLAGHTVIAAYRPALAIDRDDC